MAGKRFLRGDYYSEQEKARIMEILDLNNYNVNKTSKQVSVTRMTLTKWMKQAGVGPGSTLPATEESVIPDEITKAEEYPFLPDKIRKHLRTIVDLQDKIVTRLKLVVPEAKDAESLARALKYLHEIQQMYKQEEGTKDVVNQQNFIQIITDQIKERQNGTEDN